MTPAKSAFICRMTLFLFILAAMQAGIPVVSLLPLALLPVLWLRPILKMLHLYVIQNDSRSRLNGLFSDFVLNF
jgi:hypothetical protein